MTSGQVQVSNNNQRDSTSSPTKEILTNLVSRRASLEHLNLILVELTKRDGSFGFNINGGADNPHIPGYPDIFVSLIRDNTPASENGQIKIGDRIISVNGIELIGKTHSDAVQIFRELYHANLIIEKDAEERILNQPASSILTLPSPISAIAATRTILKSDLGSSNEEFHQSTMAAVAISTPSSNGPNYEETNNLNYTTYIAAQEDILSNGLNGESKPRIKNRESGSLLNAYQSDAHRRSRTSSLSSTTSEQNPGLPTSGGWVSRVNEDDEDRASVASVAYSTRSFVDDVPRTPKRSHRFIDLERPSVFTEMLFVSLGAGALIAGFYFGYRYFRKN